MDKYVLWAGIVGAFSAISLLIGSVIGVTFKLPKTCIGLFAAFGAGALLSALAIELIAPTITAFTSATNEIDRLRESHHFLVLVSGCAFGGVIFVLLDQLVNAKGGYLRKTAYILSKVAIERKSFHQKALNELIKSRVFVNLPYEKISLVIDHFRPRFFNAGESIFVQGDKSHGIYMIRKGIVEIYQQDHPQPIQLGHGEIIGEISFIAGRPYSADCVAKTNVELMLLTTHEFKSIQKQVPEFEQRLKDLAAERLDENKKFSEQENMEKQRWTSLAIDAIHHGTTIPSREEMGSRHAEHKNAAFAIWLGIMLDGIPESFIIGSTIIAAVLAANLAGNEPSFWSILPYTLIAGLFLSNMPEALSSSQQMKLQGMSSFKILLLWGSLVVLTGLGAALGAAISEHVGHGTLIFIEGIAAGAMLTMICAAMLPEAAHLANSNLVGLSTLAGFLCSILFKLLE